MANSKLATYTHITANHSGQRQNKVTKITPHYMAAYWTGKQCANYFAGTGRQASSNYCVGVNGDIAVSVPENCRAWTTSSAWNDNQAITIECGNNADSSLPDACYKSLVKLCADICQRYGINPHYDGTVYGTITMHKQFASTSCLPVDTEVLTPEGWKPITDIQVGELIASPHIDDLSIDFLPVKGIVPEKIQDSYTNNGITATKDHRMVYMKASSKNVYRIDEYKNLLSASKTNQIYIPLAGRSDFDGFEMTDDMLRFLIAVQADGHYMKEFSTQNYYGVEFHFAKARKIERLKGILNSVNLRFSEGKRSDGTTAIRIYNQDGVNIVDEICESYLENKGFAWDWIKLSPHQARLFLDEIMLWDGCVAGKKYSSRVKQNLEVVNAIAALNGVGSRIIGCDVLFRDTPYRTLSSDKERRNARDRVMCLTSMTGLLLVREKGVTMIVGNCPGSWLANKITSGQFERDVKAAMSGTVSAGSTALYRVRKGFDDAKSQIGAYREKANAIKSCPKGYGVYLDGRTIYQNRADGKWDREAVVKKGDTVKSLYCSTVGKEKDGLIEVPRLGGLVPVKDLAKAGDKVYLKACKIEAIVGNLVQVHGYKVFPDTLMKKVG